MEEQRRKEINRRIRETFDKLQTNKNESDWNLRQIYSFLFSIFIIWKIYRLFRENGLYAKVWKELAWLVFSLYLLVLSGKRKSKQIMIKKKKE